VHKYYQVANRGILDNLYTDDLADFVEEMPEEIVTKILKSVSAQQRKEINMLLSYKENSCGSIMTTNYVKLDENLTVTQAMEAIKKQREIAESISYCYMIDQKNKLHGAMSMRDILFAPKNSLLKDKEQVEIFGHILKPKYTECQDGFVEMSSNHVNSGIFIVSDNIVDESALYTNYFIANYNASNKEERIKIEKILVGEEASDKINDKNLLIEGTSKLTIAEASIGLGSLATFIGLYLGIIFLISSAAILALKELSESSDNKERFNMLRRIGTDEKMINKALFNQIAIFFMFPLLIAVIHSIFGIKFCSLILETFGNEQLLPSIIMTAVFIILIYGGYFIITYLCSKNIIKEKR